MKKKSRNVLVYIDENVQVQTRLTVQVDNAGDEWLTPDQVDFLEFVHTWARYKCGNQLRASSRLVRHWQAPTPEQSDAKSSDLGNSFFRTTPAFSGV
jgi:hypothetical protein